MFLKGIVLQNFRSYTQQHFTFNKQTVFVIGPNTAGKSNLMEALYLLSSGKSFRADKDTEMIAFGKEVGRVKGVVRHKVSELSQVPRVSGGEETELEVVVATGAAAGQRTIVKKYLVNNVPKRRVDYGGHFSAVLFSPQDLEIVIDSPGVRRNFLDTVLEPVDREYRLARGEYEKGIRQRNALLENGREMGKNLPAGRQGNERQFEYWDELVIQAGAIITRKREEFIEFVNTIPKEVFNLSLMYNKSTITRIRLDEYKEREKAAGVTLIGPHRDDFDVFMPDGKDTVNVKQFGSRGQQRLAVVQLKLIQMHYMEKHLGYRPILLLDDIFSELDDRHIQHIIKVVPNQQTIITTTHKEFIEHSGTIPNCDIIELKL